MCRNWLDLSAHVSGLERFCSARREFSCEFVYNLKFLACIWGIAHIPLLCGFAAGMCVWGFQTTAVDLPTVAVGYSL